METIFLSVKTTGLTQNNSHKEFTSMAIIDEKGNVLLNKKSKPVHEKSWNKKLKTLSAKQKAADKMPTNEEMQEEISSICKGKRVVIYEAVNELKKISYLEEVAGAVVCCSVLFQGYFGFGLGIPLTMAKDIAHVKTARGYDALSACYYTSDIFRFILSIKNEFKTCSKELSNEKPLTVIQSIYDNETKKTYVLEYDSYLGKNIGEIIYSGLEWRDEYKGDIAEDHMFLATMLGCLKKGEPVNIDVAKNSLMPVAKYAYKVNPNNKERKSSKRFKLTEEHKNPLALVQKTKVERLSDGKKFIMEQAFDLEAKGYRGKQKIVSVDLERIDRETSCKVSYFLDPTFEENMLKGISSKKESKAKQK